MDARLLLRMHASISFAPASSPDAASFAPAAADVSGAVCLGYGIAIAVGVLVFISTVMLASYICVRAKAGAAAVLLADDDDDGAPAASAVVVLGLDGPAIDALYPKFLHVGVGDDDDACAGAQCAICLGEFVAGDALRRGPGCGHRFHAECAERWLRVRATCPAGAAAVLLADDDDDGGAPAASAVVVLGLDGPAIDALYPKFLHVGVGDDDNACAGAQCAICLGEFVAGDALRRGPGCGHRFHAECVERWLRVSATCPVCRDSPLPSPMATPLAEAVPLAAHAR
uniref:RING-type domain-containing protein n=1 Tax=Oryza meridionalis TaxID=40149 RepID=A0A0E0F988_9ORYZ